ncbi:MAG: single-stranded-DNA-specific exonuclease RecJ, partial [Desulfobulbaceae bacterium]|nr:single-stranded-DNA-specific exonuclease RecJ [Desulfobulbaceae bacterium]
MIEMKTARQWRIVTPRLHPSNVLVNQLGIPEAVLSILANRGIIEPEEINKFLNPSLVHLPDAQLLKGLNQAVQILVEARLLKTPIIIYGDYDADGVTATALLVKFFREIELSVYYFIPDRINDGYGLNCNSLKTLRNIAKIAGHPSPVLLTVDCGITNIAEVALANELGFRVIITDHHLPGPVLPVAEAIVNPHQHGCFFPFKELAGVGVAFFLAIGLRKEFAARGVWSSGNPPNLKKYLELVAIGTIADMVQLRGVNRILVKGGLEVINNNPSIGLKALIGEIGHKESKVTAETISYYLAPRINAAGRIGSAEEALRLLLADSDESAKSSAGLLGQANQKRKELTEELANRARYQANKQLLEGSSVIVVSGDGWHLGVVGLLASK